MRVGHIPIIRQDALQFRRSDHKTTLLTVFIVSRQVWSKQEIPFCNSKQCPPKPNGWC